MTPRQADRLAASDRRQAILRAAQPLFAARGVDGVTTREVAAAANVSEALLYRHFESKTALYEAVQASCLHHSADQAARMRALPDGTATLVLAVYVIMRTILVNPAEDREEVPRLLLQSLLADGDFASSFTGLAAEHWVDKLRRCAEVSIEAGDLEGPVDRVHASVWFAHHLAAAIVFFRLPGETVDYRVPSDELVDCSVRFALRGLGLSKAAIDRYYQPAAFALLANSGAK